MLSICGLHLGDCGFLVEKSSIESVLGVLNYEVHQTLQKQKGKSHTMQAGKRLGQRGSISRQAAKPCRPSVALLDHSAFGQQYQTSFRLGQFDYFQVHVVVLRQPGRTAHP
jgi:hypothetical protein